MNFLRELLGWLLDACSCSGKGGKADDSTTKNTSKTSATENSASLTERRNYIIQDWPSDESNENGSKASDAPKSRTIPIPRQPPPLKKTSVETESRTSSADRPRGIEQPKAMPTRVEPADTKSGTRRRSARKPVIIALDFGTHSTKILLRRRDEQKARIVAIDEPVDCYPWFASPSLVRLKDGHLYFGRTAVAENGGTLYRSLKVHLLPPSDHETVRDFPNGPTPDFLVACYLAWVLHRIKCELATLDNPPVFLNLAAPMNHIENEALKTRYLQIVQAAWISVMENESFAHQQGMSLLAWSQRIRPLLERNVPDLSERRFEVLPETVAPIVSLSLDPSMAPGMYMMVDMGAGTTEFSVDHVNERGADQKILCYEDESKLLGGDNFEWLDQLPCEESGEVQSHQDELLRVLIKTHQRVWGIGYQKDAPNHCARDRWRRLTVLLAGGGTRRQEVRNAIQQANPLYPWPHQDTSYKTRSHYPTGIEFGRELTRTMRADIPLLAVAHGLSIERQKWPIVFSPGEIETQQPTDVIEAPPAFWYVEGK